ncbi:MAG TPA: DHA2 family efflux MFS transporter permease subunit [Steroidobacteraceae bacterium]|nr:DHA2 family efflux MFS transporter permease subunit [Steroidobacteraceae bacterium]
MSSALPAATPDGAVVAHRGMITVSIMLATIIQAIDGTIANVALPHMQGNLSASQDQITWVLTSYIVAAGIATPLTGWLTDQFGLKRVLLLSIAGFTLASALCGISDSLFEIVVARLLQGVFGAALVPLSQAVLLDVYPPGQHGSAMAVWGVGVMIGPIVGPALGGWLTENWSWRWVFFINLPVGALAFYGVGRYIIGRRPLKNVRFDFFGFATLSIAIGALQLFLDRGAQNDWFSSYETCAEAITCAISLAFFIAHTALSPEGKSFFDYRLLRNPNYVSGIVLMFLVGMILFSSRALLATMLQNLFDYPATLAGLVMAPSGIGTMLAMHIVGRFTGRVDVRVFLIVGFALIAFSSWQMTQYDLSVTQSEIVWPSVIQGVGLGAVFVPLATAAFATLSPALRADGTAIFSLLRNIGSAIGIAVGQAELVRNTQVAHAGIIANLSQGNLLTSPFASVYHLPSATGAASLNAEITRQATMIAYLDDFRLMLVLTVLVIPLLLLMRPVGRNGAVAASSVALE